MTSPKHQTCPDCGAELPVHLGYSTWCDQCEWNLQPIAPDGPPSLLGSLYSSFGEKHSRRLFEEFRTAPLEALAIRLTGSRVLAILLAGTIHAITLAFAVLGVVWIALYWPSPVPIVLGVSCFLIAWALRPRAAKSPRGALRKDQFPALYRLVGTISQALGGGPVPDIIVTGEFNAQIGRVGWRNAKVLSIGLPLWVTLRRQERVALLAHELAHNVNGDLTRSFFVGSAIESLEVWYQMIRPDYISRPDDSGLGTGPVEALANLIRVAVAKPVEVLAFAAGHLVWFDSQRAEYFADYLASAIAGSDAMCSALEKTHFRPIFHTTVDQSLRRRDTEGGSLLERYLGDLAAVPERELHRIKRQQNLEASRLDSTHPPTKFRMAFLKAHPFADATFVLTESEHDEVDREMRTIQDDIEHKILEAHRAQLHYGS